MISRLKVNSKAIQSINNEREAEICFSRFLQEEVGSDAMTYPQGYIKLNSLKFPNFATFYVDTLLARLCKL